MLTEMEGKRISVVVPKKEIIRAQKVVKSGPRMSDKECWLIDFRGIRSGNCVRRNKKKYHKYSGSKPAFNSPERLQKEVDTYFDSCFGFMYDRYGNIKYDKNGDPIRYQIKPFTVSGLAYAIGVSTSTLNRYCSGQFDNPNEDDDYNKYKKILVRAKQKIESYAESRLYDRDGSAGARFVLDSSFGWTTRKELTEIQEKQFNMWLKEQEFELKQKMLQMGQEDDSLEIRIVRKGE